MQKVGEDSTQKLDHQNRDGFQLCIIWGGLYEKEEEVVVGKEGNNDVGSVAENEVNLVVNGIKRSV